MSNKLEESLKTLLDKPLLDIHLRHCEEKPTSVEPPPITLLFPRFREDEPDIDSLAAFLWSQAINYVIPLKQRKRAKQDIDQSSTNGDLSSVTRLVDRTRRLFIEFRKKFPYRASEVGELIAYLLALKYLNAFQVASKMALKTNSNMPVHGLDGIHARFSEGIMTLFFLESKLAGSVESGAAEYAESVKKFAGNLKQYLLEYDIIGELNNLNALPDEDREAALEYLDVYGSQKGQRIERSVGVICYTDKDLYSVKLPKTDTTPPDAHEAALSDRLAAQYHAHRELLANKLSKNGLDKATCKVFLVAFPDINQVREKFYQVMNG